MVEGQRWSQDEASVLVAIFFSNEFSIGDDERPENALIASTLSRTNAAVDRQWRNIDAIYKGKPFHVGYTIERAVDDYESDPRMGRLEAIEICDRNGWVELIPMIRKSWLIAAPGSAEDDDVVSVDLVESVPIAALGQEWTEVEQLTTKAVVYREAQLSERFEAYLLRQGHEVVRYRITRAGLPPLYTDLADTKSAVLYEAKGSSDRMSVRLALGQILDYGRCLENVQLALLLPSHPVPDLVELLFDHAVGCVIEQDGGRFTDLTGLARCP